MPHYAFRQQIHDSAVQYEVQALRKMPLAYSDFVNRAVTFTVHLLGSPVSVFTIFLAGMMPMIRVHLHALVRPAVDLHGVRHKLANKAAWLGR